MPTFEEQVAAAVAPGPDRVASGVTLLAGTKDGIVYSRTFGTMGVDAGSPSLSPSAVSPLYSCAKLVTSLAALQCVERGLLVLDADAADVVPELDELKVLRGYGEDGKPIIEERTRKVTLRNLLTHTSGFAYAFISMDLLRYQKELGLDPLRATGDVDKLCAGPLLFQPGEAGKWSYGTGIDMAGRMVERANGGMRLGDYCQQNIFGPLGLKDFAYRFADRPELLARMMDDTNRGPDGELKSKKLKVVDPKHDCGGGGIYGTAPEYFQLLMAVFNEDARILQEKTWKMIYEPQVVSPKEPSPMTINMTIAEFEQTAPDGYEDFTWAYGLICAIFQSDVPGWMRRNTLHWGGMKNSTWFIDHESGLVTFLFTNLFPFEDPPLVKVKAAFHTEMLKRFAKPKGGGL